MDLGFAGLIEEIEKRFGKLVTNVVLGGLLLAIFLWVLQQIMGVASEIADLRKSDDAFDVVLARVYDLGVMCFLAVIVFAVFRHFDRRRRARFDAALQGVRTEAEELSRTLTAQEEERGAAMAEARATLEDYRRDTASLDRKMRGLEALARRLREQGVPLSGLDDDPS